MSTELDCYGLTPEERAEFEGQYIDPPRADTFGKYVYQDVHDAAGTWAACAKLYRPSVEAQREQIEKQAATIKELEQQVKNAQYERSEEAGRVNDQDKEISALRARIKELEREIERFMADAARLDWFRTLTEHKLARIRAYFVAFRSKGDGDVRHVIDTAMKCSK